MNKFLLIYHKEDNDGLFSAAIIIDALRHNDVATNFDLMGIDYTEAKEMETNGALDSFKENYEYVIMTDMSFSPNAMMKLANQLGNKFIWFDHHRPIIKESFKLGFDNVTGLRDINHSALYNAWMYYNNPLKDQNIKMPELYKVLSAWDSFTYEQEGYKLEYVKKINVATNAIYKLNLERIIKLVANIKDGVTNEQSVLKDLNTIGEVCVMYDKTRNENLVKTCGDTSWMVDGRKAIALFVAGPSNSEMFAAYKGTEYKHGIVFKVTASDKVTVSLYNINAEDDYDCGDYMLKKYKGGGHVGAAGCQISKSKYIQLLKTKSF